MKGPRFALAVLVLVAWLFPWLPRLRSPNELARVFETRALVDDRTLAVDGQIARHGRIGDLAYAGGHAYSSKAPGVSLLGVPVYAAVRWARGGAAKVSERACVFFLRLFVCMIPAALAAELMRQLLTRRYSERLALAGATTFALGSLMWPYSTLLMSHGPSAVALLLCLWALDCARDEAIPRKRKGRLYALAGLAAGGAVLLEYTTALVLPLLALYGLHAPSGWREKARAALFGGAGFVIPVGALAVYHDLAFGGPFETAYRHLDNPVFSEWHQRGFMGLGLPRLAPLAGSFFDPARGLFAYAPFLALALPGLPLLWRKDRPLALLCGAALTVYALFTAGFVYESWGWSVGPRHLTPLCPFLVPPAVAAADWLRSKGLGVISAALALFSVGVFALVAATGPYFPTDLTNPVHQLSQALAAMGLRSHDLLGMALGTASPWTLVPWAAGLCALALFSMRGFLSSLRPAFEIGSAVLLAGVLFFAHGLLGGPDQFDTTRRYMIERWEPTPRNAPGLFAGP